MRSRACRIPFFLLLLFLMPQESSSQSALTLPVHLIAFMGVASPSGAYQSGCAYTHFLAGAEVRTRGAWFLSGSGQTFSAGGGADVGCLRGGTGENSVTYVSGGLDLSQASRLSVGTGWALPLRPLAPELLLQGGIINGRPGYADTANPPGRRTLLWVGVQARIRLLDHLLVSWERSWTRLPFEEEIHSWPGPGEYDDAPPQPGGMPVTRREYHEWADLGSIRLGLQF